MNRMNRPTYEEKYPSRINVGKNTHTAALQSGRAEILCLVYMLSIFYCSLCGTSNGLSHGYPTSLTLRLTLRATKQAARAAAATEEALHAAQARAEELEAAAAEAAVADARAQVAAAAREAAEVGKKSEKRPRAFFPSFSPKSGRRRRSQRRARLPRWAGGQTRTNGAF